MKRTFRLPALALIAALLLGLLPALAVAAAPAELYRQSFEGANPTESGFAQLPASCEVAEEAGNHYLSVPMIPENSDRSVIPTLASIPYTEGKVVLTVRYRFDRNAKSENDQVLQCQLRTDKESWASLWRLKPHKGSVMDAGKSTGKVGNLQPGVWYRFAAVVDLAAGTYDTYINGVPAFTGGTLGTDKTGHTTRGDGFIAAKVVKQGVSYGQKKVTFDVDDVAVFRPGTEALTVTVNGTAQQVALGTVLKLGTEGKQYAFAKLTRADGSTELTLADSMAVLEDGMTVESVSIGFETLAGAGLRVSEPTGIRWLHAVNAADYAALLQSGAVSAVKLGTLITPAAYAAEAGGLTRAALEAKRTENPYVDVAATAGEWYEGEQKAGCYLFAGSLVGIRAGNYNRAFAATGYLEITLTDGQTVTLVGGYREADHARSVAELAKNALADAESGLTDAEKEAIRRYADAYKEG